MPTWRELIARGLLMLIASCYVTAGLNHFANEALYVAMVPPVLGGARAWVWISGLAELVLGLALLFPAARRRAAWGLVALLGASLPGTVYVAFADVTGLGVWNWVRLPLQAGLIAWTWTYTRPQAPDVRPLAI